MPVGKYNTLKMASYAERECMKIDTLTSWKGVPHDLLKSINLSLDPLGKTGLSGTFSKSYSIEIEAPWTPAMRLKCLRKRAQIAPPLTKVYPIAIYGLSPMAYNRFL